MWRGSVHCLLVVAPLLGATACTHWQTQHVSPEQGFAARQPGAVRLTLTDSSHVWLKHPVLTDSTFEGISRDTVTRVPRSRVATWSLRRPGSSPELKVVAAGAGLAMLIYLATWEPWPD